MKKKNYSRFVIYIIFMVSIISCGTIVKNVPAIQQQENTNQYRDSVKIKIYSGTVYLYGETHGVVKILNKEFDLWYDYYHTKGMRHLFVELPFFTAEFLNVWMKSTEDTILESLYSDWQGTALHNTNILAFYKKIKKQCPETVFHGTDVGHQYDTTGKSYMRYLEDNKLIDTEEYKLTQEAIAQGINYYSKQDNCYRENMMVLNFIRELKKIDNVDIMAIYGSAHTGLKALVTNQSVSCMANQLHTSFSINIHSEDLSFLAKEIDPMRVDSITAGGKIYRALYFGKKDLVGFKNYEYREFWCLEGAYDALKDKLKTGNVLPYNNYPMTVESNQVYVIDYKMTDGSKQREFHRSDGRFWKGLPITEEFILSN